MGASTHMWRPGTGFWITVLACVTAVLIPVTPWAFIFVMAAEAFDGGPPYYHWLSVVPLLVVSIIWVFVCWKWHREDSQRGHLEIQKGRPRGSANEKT